MALLLESLSSSRLTESLHYHLMTATDFNFSGEAAELAKIRLMFQALHH